MSLRVCIYWLPSESFGLHAEAIKKEMDEIAEIMTEGFVKGVREGTVGYFGTCVSQ